LSSSSILALAIAVALHHTYIQQAFPCRTWDLGVAQVLPLQHPLHLELLTYGESELKITSICTHIQN
jgi:hypothetical protein